MLTYTFASLYSNSRRISAQTTRIFTWMFRISHVSIASSLTHNDLVVSLPQHAQKKLAEVILIDWRCQMIDRIWQQRFGIFSLPLHRNFRRRSPFYEILQLPVHSKTTTNLVNLAFGISNLQELQTNVSLKPSSPQLPLSSWLLALTRSLFLQEREGEQTAWSTDMHGKSAMLKRERERE